jgi:hypothetical protein
MDVSLDVLLNIAFRADYQAINSLICTCKYYSEYPNIWKIACQTKFPNKSYFDFWTSKENYLVHERKSFALGINFGLHKVSNYIYEYDDTFPKILEFYGQFIPHNVECKLPVLLEFSVQAQFVVAVEDDDLNTFIYGQADTYQGAIDMMCSKYESDNIPEYADSFEWAIIDLANCKPYFWKMSKKPLYSTYLNDKIHDAVFYCTGFRNNIPCLVRV